MKEAEAIEIQHILHDELPPDLVPDGRDRPAPRRPTTHRMDPSATSYVSADDAEGPAVGVHASISAEEATVYVARLRRSGALAEAVCMPADPGDLVDRLVLIAKRAGKECLSRGSTTLFEDGVRAVLAELAAMGADDALPSESEIAAAWSVSANEEREVRELCRSRIAPILAAKDGELAKSEHARKLSERTLGYVAAQRDGLVKQLDVALAEVERLKAELARAQAAPGGLSEEAIAKVNAAFRGEKSPTSQCPAHEPGSCSICR